MRRTERQADELNFFCATCEGEAGSKCFKVLFSQSGFLVFIMAPQDTSRNWMVPQTIITISLTVLGQFFKGEFQA